jgi:hypothetical protein
MKKIEEIFENWKKVKHYLALLPILEYDYDEIINSKNIDNEFIIVMNKFILFALIQSQYWSELALKWIESGFIPNDEIMNELNIISNNKAYSQNMRHRSKTIINKFRKQK